MQRYLFECKCWGLSRGESPRFVVIEMGLGAGGRYLEVALPYEVEDDSKCSATRDKAGLLKITMPVKPPKVSPPSTAVVDDVKVLNFLFDC